MDHYEMELVEQEPQPVLVVKFQGQLASLPQEISQALPAVFEYARQHSCEVCGPPFARHSTLNDDFREFWIGVPVRSEVEGNATVSCEHLPGGKIARTLHVGPHEQLEVARRTLNTWVRDNDLKLVDGPWEVYLTDPMLEPDMTRWETEMFQAVSR